MANITNIPIEILRNILSHLNVLDNKGTPLIRHVNPKKGPDHIGITFHKTNPDTSLFDAMRVCKTWRDLIFGYIFNEDVTRWSTRQWQQEIDRFRTVERAVLVELTRTVVLLWKNAAFQPDILGRSAFEGWRTALADENNNPDHGDGAGGEAGEGNGDESNDTEPADGNVGGPSATGVDAS